ncbi:hypothetical protein GN956_G26967, partial [Arapaima gigas]
MKNMLMMPRYLIILVPGRKESGVILTTETVLPGHDLAERSERKRPSVCGLAFSWEEAVKVQQGGRQTRDQTWPSGSAR